MRGLGRADCAIPGRRHYSIDYLLKGRVFSYAHQIDTALAFRPESVLEVGIGGGMVRAALASLEIPVTTVDVQPELQPDFVASATDLPFDDGRFDIALMCQVLEHLPFEQFERALSELYRVTRSGAVISLPDVTRYGFLSGKLPRIPEFTWNFVLPRLRQVEVTSERFERDGHYWEIGTRGTPLKRIRAAILAAGWKIHSDWRVPELRWHHFFRLEH